MRLGKVSNTILDRSVFKLIKKRDKHLEKKPACGIDAARIGGAGDTLVSTEVGKFAVYKVANNIAAARGKISNVSCSIIIDERSREIRLKEIMTELDRQCSKLDISIAGGHTTVSRAANKPIVSVTGIGFTDTKETRKAKPGQDIIITKCIGISGIRQIVDAKREEILKLYSEDVITKAIGEEEEMLVASEAELFSQYDKEGAMKDVSEGGIFGALWDLAEFSGVGLEIDFRSIPVRQEVIEICEMWDINPYNLESLGCLLMTSENGCDIVRILDAAGIKASVIGKITGGNDRIIHNLSEDRYLTLPEQDEVYKIVD